MGKPNIEKINKLFEKGDIDGLIKCFWPLREDDVMVSVLRLKLTELMKGLGMIKNEEMIEALVKKDFWIYGKEGLRVAARISGMIKKRDVERLIKALKDKNPLVPGLAISALGAIGDKRAVEPLIEVLHSCVTDRFLYLSDVARSKQAAKALGAIKDERAIDRLIGMAEFGKYRFRNPKTEYTPYGPVDDMKEARTLMNGAVDALRNFDNWQARVAVALYGGSEGDIQEAAEVLVKMEPKREVEDLINVLLHEEDINMRVRAAKILGRMKDERAIKPLVVIEGDRERDAALAKEAISDALKEFDTTKVQEFKEKFSQDRERFDRGIKLGSTDLRMAWSLLEYARGKEYESGEEFKYKDNIEKAEKEYELAEELYYKDDFESALKHLEYFGAYLAEVNPKFMAEFLSAISLAFSLLRKG